MPRYEIAHLQVQGQDAILIALDRGFALKSDAEKEEIREEFQMRCRSAGLRGHVALVWDAGGGSMGFIGPPNWRSYLRSINVAYAIANRNRYIEW